MRLIKKISLPGFNRRMLHFIIAALICAIFVLFFTSRVWMSATDTITETPIGTTYQASSTATLTLRGWKLRTVDNSIIVDIGLTDLSVDRQLNIALGVLDASGRALDGEILYNGNEFLLLSIPKGYKQKVITVYMQVQQKNLSGETEGKPKTHSFSVLVENIQASTDLPLEPSEPQCILYDMQASLELLIVQRQQCEADIASNQDIITNAQQKIEERVHKQQYQTTAEIAENNKQIEQLQNTILAAEKAIGQLNESLLGITEEIANKQQIIEEYKHNNNI